MLAALEGGAEYFAWKAQEKTFAVDGSPVKLKGFLIDPTSLQVGWGKWENQIPTWEWNPDLEKRMPSPDPSDKDWKVAVGVKVFVSEEWGSHVTGERLWQSNQVAHQKAIQNLWNEQGLHEQAQKKPGKWAKIAVKGKQEIKIGQGSTTIPTLEIKGWVDAPEIVPSASSEPTPTEDIDDDYDPF